MAEPFFVRPFRSKWRNLWYNVSHIPYFLKTWWAYKGILWHDHDFDHIFMWALLEFKLRRMSIAIQNGYHVGKERDVRRILMAAELCRRMAAEEYMFKFQHDAAPDFVSVDFQHCDYLQEQDLGYLTMLLRKYSRMWWS